MDDQDPTARVYRAVDDLDVRVVVVRRIRVIDIDPTEGFVDAISQKGVRLSEKGAPALGVCLLVGRLGQNGFAWTQADRFGLSGGHCRGDPAQGGAVAAEELIVLPGAYRREHAPLGKLPRVIPIDELLDGGVGR